MRYGRPVLPSFLFFFNDTATTEIYTLSLHDALPIPVRASVSRLCWSPRFALTPGSSQRSEEHTSELQSRFDLVCRLLLEKKIKIFVDLYIGKKNKTNNNLNN